MTDTSMTSRVAIVGAGHAGGRVAQHLRTLGHRGPIALIGDEAHAPYERPALSKALLMGEATPEALTLEPATFWNEAHPTLRIDRHFARARRVFVDERQLQLDDTRHTRIDFDQLVIATGGVARVPPIDGIHNDGVHTLRTIDDCLALREQLRACERLVIIGAGVIGMEVAASAIALGVRVTVLEAGDRIMSRLLPPMMSAWLTEIHRAQGVVVKTGTRVKRVERGPSGALVVVHGDEVHEAAHEEADLVLIAAGIACRTDFLDGTGMTGQPDAASRQGDQDTAHDAAQVDGGVPVDHYCRSVIAPWCYAAGDVAVTFNSHYGRYMRQETWRNAENQARAVAEFICGRRDPFLEMPWMWTDQYVHNIQVVGRPGPDDELIVRGRLGYGPATVIAVRDRRVSGAVMVDQGRDRKVLERWITERTAIDVDRLSDLSLSLRQFA